MHTHIYVYIYIYMYYIYYIYRSICLYEYIYIFIQSPIWYQVRALLKAPIAVGAGHTLEGKLRFEANDARGYNVHIEVRNANTGVTAANVCVTQCALHHFQYASQTSQSSPGYYSPGVSALPLPEQPAFGEP